MTHLRQGSGGQARLLALIDRFRRARVTVVGDLVADEFIYGRLSRVSREAPVLILEYDTTEIVPGGAGNAASNVAALGGKVTLVGAAGRDEAGDRLMAALQERDVRLDVARPRDMATPVKTRILAGGVHSVKQQIVRIDRQGGGGARPAIVRDVTARAKRSARKADAIIASDYGSGLINAKVIARIRPRGAQLFVDSRYQLLDYGGMTACTPNESEVEALLGVKIGDAAKVLEKAGRTLLRKTGAEAMLVTRGSRGMALFEPGEPTLRVPIFGSDEVADVTGAGDTVIATFALARAAGATFAEAARLANFAGGLVVMKRGTATISADELRAAVRSGGV
jgi:rfaE bifunctional protein kinase chain/domain